MGTDQTPPPNLYGQPYVISRDDDGDDVVYCGLHKAHSGFHVAMVWFWDDKTIMEGWRWVKAGGRQGS